MGVSDDLHAIPRLVGDAAEQLGKLVQNEVQLARAELSEKVTQASLGAGFLAGAAVFAIPVLVLLMLALAMWLSDAFELSEPAAHAISAGVGAIFAIILVLTGMSYLKSENLKPKVTIQQVERDLQTAKEMAR
jgi:uncharacterized membrane protein YqjE